MLELSLRPAGRVWRLPMQQLVDKHPEGPDIGFGSVDVVDEALRRHIDGRPDVNILELFPS